MLIAQLMRDALSLREPRPRLPCAPPPAPHSCVRNPRPGHSGRAAPHPAPVAGKWFNSPRVELNAHSTAMRDTLRHRVTMSVLAPCMPASALLRYVQSSAKPLRTCCTAFSTCGRWRC